MSRNMEIGEIAFWWSGDKVQHGTIVAMRGDEIVCDDGEGFRFHNEFFKHKTTALLDLAKHKRKVAMSNRKRGAELIAEAERDELVALDALLEVNKVLRGIDHE